MKTDLFERTKMCLRELGIWRSGCFRKFDYFFFMYQSWTGGARKLKIIYIICMCIFDRAQTMSHPMIYMDSNAEGPASLSSEAPYYSDRSHVQRFTSPCFGKRRQNSSVPLPSISRSIGSSSSKYPLRLVVATCDFRLATSGSRSSTSTSKTKQTIGSNWKSPSLANKIHRQEQTAYQLSCYL